MNYLKRWLGLAEINGRLKEGEFKVGYVVATLQERIMALERRIGNLESELVIERQRSK